MNSKNSNSSAKATATPDITLAGSSSSRWCSQIGGHDSHRSIETSLGKHAQKWYHLGLQNIRRSTLSDAIQKRPWQIFEGQFYRLLNKCKSVTQKPALFDRRRRHGTLPERLSVVGISSAQRSHQITVPQRSRRLFARIHGYDRRQTPRVRVAKSEEKLDFHLLSDSIVSFDRGYLDFKWLYSLDQRGVWFVTRAKKNLQYRVTGQDQPI